MYIKKDESWQLRYSQRTPKELFKSRRGIMKSLFALSATAAIGAPLNAALKFAKSDSHLDVTDRALATSYNNFYEFAFDKHSVKEKSKSIQPSPWKLTVSGEVQKSLELDLYSDVIDKMPLVERIYRFRCVEGWSMVVPWIGLPLHTLLEKAGRTPNAKYVQFISKEDSTMFPEQAKESFGNIPFPYKEGLRIDEAMHPLVLLGVGMYGELMPKQNGAPVRLVVPWKYGFKNIKSIDRIVLTKDEPISTWHDVNPREYGFYANVNPAVDHPRWSQAKERVLGKFFKQNTLPFNGYDKEVASLYRGMDLKRNF